MQQPDVDVIIPVHTRERPIHRAVRSVLRNRAPRLRVSVVAHNIDPSAIRDNLRELADDPRVRVLALDDGIPSPSGPMNHGIAETDADYFAVMGSDDELADGAVDSWLALARETRASAVIARVEDDAGRADPSPPTRRARMRDLDPVRDRLAYRCMPLGLISATEFDGLQFSPALRSGEDIEFTARLWFTGRSIAYDRTGPAYIVHADADDRVTREARPVAEDFAFLDVIAAAPWYSALARPARLALAVKNLRLHLLDAIAARLDAVDGLAAHRDDLVAIMERIEGMAPGAIARLSRADRDALDELRAPDPSSARIRAAIGARWGGAPRALLPRNPLLAFSRQGPLLTRWGTRA